MDQLQKEQFLAILEKFEAGTATKKEIEFLNAYYKSFHLRDSFIGRLSDTEREQLKNDLLCAVTLHIASAPVVKTKIVRFNNYILIASAAAIIVMLGIGFLFYNHQSRQDRDTALANNIAPGKNSATLMLSNGKKIILSQAIRGKLAVQAGVTISKTADGKLVYKIGNETSAGKNSNNILSTARGEQYQVVLPDGSHVWLNAASSLKYPASFADQQQRKVELTGEAYFEVAKDKAHPFIVKTAQQEVEVLGTHFNVEAYSDELAIKTTLLEGSVQVAALNGSKVKIKPGEQAYLINNGLNIREADLDAAVAWKNGEFMFNSEPLENIMNKVARWYDVKIEFKANDMKSKTFDGTISRFDNVAKVLKKLELTGHVHFRIDKRTIIVMN